MAYADLEFYKTKYFGDVVPDEEFPKFSERASDFLDVITFDRLVDGLPSNQRSADKVRKAVCAVSDSLYQLDLAQKQSLNAVLGTSSQSTENGTHSGIITSVSAGSESISYASMSQMASGAKEWSAIFDAVGDQRKTNKLLQDTASMYLMGVSNDDGVLLLYAGL